MAVKEKNFEVRNCAKLFQTPNHMTYLSFFFALQLTTSNTPERQTRLCLEPRYLFSFCFVSFFSFNFAVYIYLIQKFLPC